MTYTYSNSLSGPLENSTLLIVRNLVHRHGAILPFTIYESHHFAVAVGMPLSVSDGSAVPDVKCDQGRKKHTDYGETRQSHSSSLPHVDSPCLASQREIIRNKPALQPEGFGDSHST